MKQTKQLAEIVLARNAETEATQEKLVALVTRHHEELGQLLEVLPELKREALDNINARLESVIADATSRTAAISRGQQAEFAATAEFKMGEKMRVIEPLLASLQATRDEIQAQLAGLGQKHTESLAEITGSLTGIAEERARAVLASDETKAVIRAALDEQTKPILAALESKGGSFIDLYQGDFVEGRSSAKRGEIWSYFGNTVLCLVDTVMPPAYLQGSSSQWALLAARGANGQPGPAGTGGGGGGSGDVVGPDGATDGAPALFDTTTGKLLKNSTPTGTGNPVLQTSPVLTTPNIGTPSAGVLTNCTGLPLAGMADLAQDQFIGRTTASTGVPQTATITAAARAVLDDATVAAMVDTLGGAASTGTGGLVRAASPTLSGTITVTGAGGATLDNSSASAGTISSSGGGQFDITAPIQLSGNVKDSAGSTGTSGYALIGNGTGALTYQFIKRSTMIPIVGYSGQNPGAIGSTETFFGGNNRHCIRFDFTGYTQARLRIHLSSTASNATTTIYARYYTANSTTLSDFIAAGAGATEVSVGLGTTTSSTYMGNWTNLTAGAIADVWFVLVCKDTANGALNPPFSSCSLELR